MRDPELIVPGERLANYASQVYATGDHLIGRSRSINLLLHSFDHLDIPATADRLVAASRAERGLGGTVWGIKQDAEGALSWEFYYYYHWDKRPLTLGTLARVLDDAGASHVDLPASDRSWYSLSFDLTEDHLHGRRPVDGIHLYSGISPSQPRAALSYALRDGAAVHENLYHLFNPKNDVAAIREQLAESVHDLWGAGPPPVWPELLGGDHVAVVRKPTADGLYYGGIDIGALCWFCATVGFAPWFRERLEAERASLDHLRFDVGVDFRWDRNGPRVVKTGVYASF